MGKKYTIPFRSLRGNACNIDIYDADYTGDVITLTGAPQPIVFDENDDEDLLTVVRAKTGYINLVETTYGELDGVFPDTNTSRLVKAYYNGVLSFVGFIQAQSFQNKWAPAPREVSLPIMSPLAMLNDIKMPVYNPPQRMALNVLLADVIDILLGMGADYTTVVWPKMDVTLSATVSSLTVCPFNGGHEPAFINDDLFEPDTAGWYIEALCNAFGWMVHETPSVLVFSKVDHDGEYISCSVANLRTLNGAQVIGYEGETPVNLTDYATPADGDGEVSNIMPKEIIELSYQGKYMKDCAFDFSHLTFHSWDNYSNAYVAWLQSFTPELTGQALLFKNYFDNQGALTTEGATACSCGSISDQTECILVNLPKSTVHTTELFTIKFFERPTGNGMQFKCDFMWAAKMWDLGTDEEVHHKAIGIKVKVGSQWYHGAGVWSTSVPNPFGYADDPEGISWDITNTPAGLPIEVSFYEITVQPSGKVPLLAVTNIELNEMPTVFSDYRVRKHDTDNISVSNGTGTGTATVDMGLNCYREGTNQIGSTLQQTRFTNYTYLLYSQERLRVKFRRIHSLQYWWYIVRAVFSSLQWRVIGISENPYDDEYEIIMHRSLQN